MNEMSSSPLPPEIAGNPRGPEVVDAVQVYPRLRLSAGRLTDLSRSFSEQHAVMCRW